MTDYFPVVIHHNPGCGTSRNVVELVRASGYEPEIIPYLDTGWTRDQLVALFAAAGKTPREMLRVPPALAAEYGVLEQSGDGAVILDAMVAHPILVNRPIVATPKGVELCRPSESVIALLDRKPDRVVLKEDGAVLYDPGAAS
ncbi:MAG: arsenate reductase family protein [Hyphomonadaceae bacterium]|nr:MAG: arsenate reductase [Caulobacteraceae bacterium]MBT9446787.1 arsenate reductase family protein [Hyphomonadaceae bacterium]TPW04353.1 MAG: arsenate reductase [Alphaproteobacteria bacterium]